MLKITFTKEQIEKFGGAQKVESFILDNRKRFLAGEKVTVTKNDMDILGQDNVKKIFTMPAKMPDNFQSQNNQSSSFMDNVGSVVGRVASAVGSGLGGAIDTVTNNQLAPEDDPNSVYANEDLLNQKDIEELKKAKQFVGDTAYGSYEDLSRHRMLKGAPGVQETINNWTGYNPETASGWEKGIDMATNVLATGVPLKNAIGIGSAQLIPNLYDYEKNPVKALLFDILKDILGGVLGGKIPNAVKAIKSPQKTADKIVSKAYAKLMADGMSKKSMENFLKDVKNGRIVDPRQYVDKPKLLPRATDKLELKHKGATDIEENQSYVSKILDKSFDRANNAKGADFNATIKEFRDAPRVNSEANKAIKKFSDSKDILNFPKTEKSIGSFLSQRSVKGEALEAAKEAVGNLKPLVSDETFLNLYEKQISNKFKNYTKEFNFNGKVPELKSELQDGFKKFVIQCGENGINIKDAKEFSHLLETYKIHHKAINETLKNGGDAIVSGFVNKSLHGIPSDKALDIMGNFEKPYDSNLKQFRKNKDLGEIHGKMSKEIKDSNPAFKKAYTDIATNKSKKAGYEIVKALQDFDKDKESVFKIMSNLEGLKEARTIIKNEKQLERFDQIKVLKAQDMLKEVISGGSPSKVIANLTSEGNKVLFKELLGKKNYHAFINDVERIGEYTKGIMLENTAKPLKELSRISKYSTGGKATSLILSSLGYTALGWKSFFLAPAIQIAFNSHHKMSAVMTTKSFAKQVSAFARAYSILGEKYPNRFIGSLVEKGKRALKKAPNKLIKNRAVIAANLNKFEKSKNDKSKR